MLGQPRRTAIQRAAVPRREAFLRLVSGFAVGASTVAVLVQALGEALVAPVREGWHVCRGCRRLGYEPSPASIPCCVSGSGLSGPAAGSCSETCFRSTDAHQWPCPCLPRRLRRLGLRSEPWH